ncbi:hypothetical protein BC940DRAFT_300401 [Gongronella butleri]|nr:hypothetical protein BC940DRAFT_300401 [Gongronella butleri]
MPLPPTPHGLPHDFFIPETQFRAWKMANTLAGVPVRDWVKPDVLCNRVLECCPHATTATTAYNHILSTLTKISKKVFDSSLKLYCDRVQAYLAKAPVKDDFAMQWKHSLERAQLRRELNQEESTSSIKADLLGQKLVGNMLSKRLEDPQQPVEETREPIDDQPHSEEAQPHSEDDQLHIVDQQHQQSIEKGKQLIEKGNQPVDKGKQPIDDDQQPIDDGQQPIDNGQQPIDAQQTSLEPISTILARAGEKLRLRETNGDQLSRLDRKIMTACLSSMLDFIERGQHSLFGDRWKGMEDSFKTQFPMAEPALPPQLKQAWEKVVELCHEQNAADARAYVAAEIDKNRDKEAIVGLELIQQLLIAYRRHHHLLDPFRLTAPAEYDLAFKLWLPLFDCLFADETFMSTRISETVNVYTAAQKQNMYANSSRAPIAFKIDIRFILTDRNGRQEIDMCAVEAAKNCANDNKIMDDHSKLLREGKDILDRLFAVVVEKEAAADMQGFIIQLGSTQGQISTIHLSKDDDIYVAIPRHRLLFPGSTASIRRFEPTLAALLHLRRHMRTMARIIKEQQELIQDKRNSLGTSHGRPAPTLIAHPFKKKMRPTWYTPPHQ